MNQQWTADTPLQRVMHLRTVTGRGGGPEKTLLNSPAAIGSGYEMCLVYFHPEDDPDFDMPERARQKGVSLVSIPERGPFDWKAMRRLWRVVRDYRPHILHAHDYKTNVLSILANRWFRIPVVTTMHGNVERNRRLNLYYRTDRWSLRRMNHIIAVSDELHEYVLSLGVTPDRCTMIANGVQVDDYVVPQDRTQFRVRWEIPANAVLVAAIGRLSAEKGFDRLIRAVHEVRQEGLDVYLLIAGSGAEFDELRRLVDRLSPENGVRLIGYCEDVVGLLAAADIFVSSSLREGLPNAILEAMAMRLPVVATRVGAVPRLVRDEQTGILVAPDSVTDLSAAIRRLATNRELAQAFGQQGRELVEKEFSFKRRMERVRAVYEAVLGNRSCPATASLP